ncbi:MAG: cytochrome c [Bacteroidetes bacterium]|nr:cytochrome c [Bacteroidota bacterium]MCK6610166.1 cytochrome c [Bacteroidia bacterium]
MKTTSTLMALALAGMLYACGDSGSTSGSTETNGAAAPEKTEEQKAEHDNKGIGSITSVTLNNPLDEGMVKAGKDIYDLKCSSCHKLDGTRVVGPGWEGVTSRRKPEWIMNFITNVDEMLNKDAEAMAMLEECLVRMPNQNLTEKDARDVLEFMYKNDIKK